MITSSCFGIGCSEVNESAELDMSDATMVVDELQPGQAAIHLSYWAPGRSGDPVDIRHVAESPRIIFDEQQLMCPPGWGLRVPVTDPNVEEDFVVFFWFEDTNEDVRTMSGGQGELSMVNVDIPAIEHGGANDGPFDNPMTITQSTGSLSSGSYSDSIEIEVAFYAPSAPLTGEKFLVRSIVFREVATDIPSQDSPVGECRNTRESSDCAVTYNGTCFPSLMEACEAAGCSADSCNASESLPAQVACN